MSKIRIALAGNPNSGKTTLFNALTGANQYVGNWPGVTVEKKEGKLKKEKNVRIVDLPGIYSLSPYTLEEVVARNYILNEKPDAIINIIDGTNLERSLYLTTQLIETGFPVVVAVNMMDVLQKRGDNIDSEAISKALGCKVVEISAAKNKGIKELIKVATDVAENGEKQEIIHKFDDSVEEAINRIESALSSVDQEQRRFMAIKIFEQDKNVLETLPEKIDVNGIISEIEKKYDDDSESIIISERYSYISEIIGKCFKKGGAEKLSLSDKIDKVVTNRILALPIFVLIMWFVYWVSMATIGQKGTDWLNETFEESLVPGFGAWLESVGVTGWIHDMLTDGIFAGVGAVLGFVPQMLVLFFMLAILEFSGYLARVAFIMDRIFRRFGLSGKSFIPMLISSGCGIPGVMASRTIENEKDRRMTIMTTTFIPCAAKLPLIAMIAGAFFGKAPWVATAAYFIGVAAIVVSGIMLKKMRIFSGEPSPFVMELPDYHFPKLTAVLRSMWERGWSFIKKAGTIIVLASIFIWFMSGYGWVNGKFGPVEDMNESILASVGRGFAWIFEPLGFAQWKSAVAAIMGLVAKEEVIGTFGILYGTEDAGEIGENIWARLAKDYTSIAAFSFLIFNLLCAPCFAAIGAIKREMNSAKWTLFAVGYETVFAYLVSLMVYQLGMLFITGSFGFWTVVAFIILAVFIYLIVRPQRNYVKESLEREAGQNA